MNIINLPSADQTLVLKLDVLGYSYPASSGDWYEILIDISQGNRHFVSRASALEAVEMHALMKWFDALSQAKLPRYASLSFLESYLAFGFKSFYLDRLRFSLTLEHELKPSFSSNQFGASTQDWEIVFEASVMDVRMIVSNISAVLEKYPIRGKSSIFHQAQQLHEVKETVYQQMFSLSTEELSLLYAECESRAAFKVGEKMLQDGWDIELVAKYCYPE